MTVLIPGLYGLDTASAWRALQKDPQKYMDKFAKDKSVQREIDYFNSKATKITNIDDLMKDRRMLQFVLDAYGMGSEIKNAGRIKKILTEDPTASGSLVNRLSDPKFKAMAMDLRLDQNFNKFALRISRDGMVENYIQSEFEEALGDQDNALRQAAYFASHADSISDVYSVLGDKVLRDVVQTTFSIPAQLAIQPVETQATALAKRVDVTKFKTSLNGTVSASQLTRAKSDYDLLNSTLGVSDAAVKQIKTLQEKLTSLVTDYSHLTANTDPLGANAAMITQQQTAVPELVRYDQLLQGGNTAIASVKSKINSMIGLISQAGNSSSNLSDLKTQFSGLISGIATAINSAAITAPDGSTQNILANGSNDTISIDINGNGSMVTINRHDLSTLQNALSDAQSAFNAISSSSDSANIITAHSKLLNSLDRANAIDTTLDADRVKFDEKVKAQDFYATLNSVDLTKGKNSIDDANSRIIEIKKVLTSIGKLAVESKKRDVAADRSDLATQYDAYRTQIRDLIEDAGDPAFDNLLNNSPDRTYEIINGQSIAVKGGYDLLTQIADVLDAGDITTQSGAIALENTAILVSVHADKTAAGLAPSKSIIDRAVGTFDPKASLDTQIYTIKSQLDALISGAAVNGKNLLDVAQKDIRTDLNTGVSLKFRAQTTFKSDFSAAIDAAIAQIGVGSMADVANALDDALDLVDRTQRTLSGDNRSGTLELGKLGGIIDTLTPKETNEDNPYKVNEFTQKFLVRYLTQNQLVNGGTSSGANSYVLSLFGGSTASANSIASLALSV